MVQHKVRSPLDYAKTESRRQSFLVATCPERRSGDLLGKFTLFNPVQNTAAINTAFMPSSAQ